jgi:hypothetical protein
MATGTAIGASLTPRLIVGLLALGLATTGLVVANMFLYAVIGEINGRKPAGERISYFGFTPGKMSRIFAEYRRIKPAGRLHVYAWGSFALAMISLLACAVCIGFFG